MKSRFILGSILNHCAASLCRPYLHANHFIFRMASNSQDSLEPTTSTESQPESKPFRKSREHPEFDSRHRKKVKQDEGEIDNCHYHTENCLKFVQPYYFDAKSFAKGRWVNRSIIDVTSSEFTSHPREYYAKAIVNGRLRLNGKKITNLDAIIKNGDRISHLMHRHEPPILSKLIDIVHMDSDILVINKPSSIPVHPSGRYHFNTLIYLLRIEYGFSDIFPVHRLDRLTSGIMIFARNSKASRRIHKLLQRREITKEYVCIVQGKFPDDKIDVDKSIVCVSHQIGVCRITCDSDEGKPSETSFECLAFNGERSLVKCMPKTGRMHQIRVHLQHLGFPIINDPIYNHPAWELPKYDQNEIPCEKVEEMIALLKQEISIQEDVINSTEKVTDEKSSISNAEVVLNVPSESKDKPCASSINYPDDYIMKHPLKYGNINLTQKELHAIYDKLNPNPDPTCENCKSLKNIPHMCMYLHAMTYKSCDWEFRTKLPDWADEFDFETKAEYTDFVNIVPKEKVVPIDSTS